MNKLRLLCAFLAASLLLHPFSMMSQDRKLVTGKITNKMTGKPFGKNDVIISIYAFDTVAQAEEALSALNGGGFVHGAYEAMPPDITGYYQVTVPETGAIVFKPDMKDGFMEKVRGRAEINVSIDIGQVIESAVKTEKSSNITPLEEEVQIEGNWLYAVYTFKLPENVGKSNARLILQPFFLEGGKSDTLAFLKPWVYDGEEYHLTQERRMGYESYNDPLMKYVVRDTANVLSEKSLLVPWRDTIYLENPRGRYYVRGRVQVEDYNKVYYLRDSLPLASSRARRPMQFLDYNLEQYQLDPEQYHERPLPEQMNTAGEISLTFLVGQAKLDDRDPMNEVYMNDLKKNLHDIVYGEISWLKEFHIVGISSPDGTYAKNLELAGKRMAFAQAEITSVIPKKKLRLVYTTTKAKVAPWSAVADLMEKDGLDAEAQRLRKIIAAEKSHDAQGAAIRKLPFYRTTVTKYLPKLRTVRYVYSHEEMRELTPEEIMARYRSDQEYISGKKHFKLYEYWHLFRMLKDEKELDDIYKRAYEETKEDIGTAWIFAANKFAASCLKKGIADTTILSPYIDTRFQCNRKFTNMDKTIEIVNPDAVVANQLCMYLMTGNFQRASIMAQMLPKSKYKDLIAVTMCLGGRYKGGKTAEEKQERAEYFETVMNSGPRNKVVMLLSQNTRAYDQLAEKALAELPQDDALTWYFRAVLSCRKCKRPDADFMEPQNFEYYLGECLRIDPTYLGIAQTDGDIDEDMLKEYMKYNM